MGIRQLDLVKLWSLSSGRISQMVKDGMPLDSVESAERFRMAKYGWHGGIFSSSTSSEGGAGKTLPPPPAKPEPRHLDRNDEAGVQARVNQAELDAWQALYVEVVKGEKSDSGSVISLRKAYREAVATRLDSAKKLAEIQARAGAVVSADSSRLIVEAALSPIVKRLRALPQNCASACCPQNPGAAKEVLEAWVVETMNTVQAALLKAGSR